jgi:hypothetical protein
MGIEIIVVTLSIVILFGCALVLFIGGYHLGYFSGYKTGKQERE